jgi:hypothetical protein
MTPASTQTNPFQLTPNPSDLDIQLQALVETHGIGAVGESLAHQYGKTRVIAATLGQRPDTVSCISIQHPPQSPPPNPVALPQPWYQDVLGEIAEQLTAISDSLERQITHQCLASTKTVLLNSALAALGVAINCIRLYQQDRDGAAPL